MLKAKVIILLILMLKVKAHILKGIRLRLKVAILTQKAIKQLHLAMNPMLKAIIQKPPVVHLMPRAAT